MFLPLCMIMIKGYTPIDYETLQGILYDAYKRSKKTYFKLAQESEVNSTQTPINAITSKVQKVSDSKLIRIAQLIGVDLVIAYFGFNQYYYIKNKSNHYVQNKTMDNR